MLCDRSLRLAFIGVCLGVTGCADLNNVSRTHHLEAGLKAFTYSDDLQNTFVRKTSNGVRICSQADPDAAQSFSEGIEAGMGYQSEGAKDSVAGSSLGGRNPEVLILRELMFRACELSANYDVNYQEARTIYSEFLNAAVSMSVHEVGTGAQATGASVTSVQSISRGSESDADTDSDK